MNIPQAADSLLFNDQAVDHSDVEVRCRQCVQVTCLVQLNVAWPANCPTHNVGAKMNVPGWA